MGANTPLTLKQARQKQNEQMEELWRMERLHATSAPSEARVEIKRSMDRLRVEIKNLDETIAEHLNVKK
jgi:hypothetical protein